VTRQDEVNALILATSCAQKGNASCPDGYALSDERENELQPTRPLRISSAVKSHTQTRARSGSASRRLGCIVPTWCSGESNT